MVWEKDINGYRQIFNSFKDELMVIDRSYRIVEANEAVLLRHGKRRQEVVGKYCYQVSHGRRKPCRLPNHECPLDEVWKTGESLQITHRHVYSIGEVKEDRYIDIVASPIKNSQGEVVAVSELMRDVTDIKKIEEQAAEAYRNLSALNTIASTVSRSLDLDTVLNGALTKTLEIMNRNTGGILLWDEERKMLRYRVHNSLSKEYVQSVYLHPGEGVVGIVAQTGKSIVVDDISTDPRVAHPGIITTEGLRAFAAIPLRSKDKVLGVLTIASHDTRQFSSEDIQLLDSIASQIAVAVENAKLHQEIQLKDKSRGELLGEILTIQEEERRRIARELHDETSQSLAALAANIEAIASKLPSEEDEAKNRLRKIQQVALDALDEIYKLIYELRPTLLDDLGLVAAIRWLVDNKLTAANVNVNFKTIGRTRRLLPKLEIILFRVIQEAVSNITRYAQAKKVELTLHFKKNLITGNIRDNGKGFDVEEAISSKDRPRGLGLLGMKERIELINGTLTIQSSRGKGTEINIEIPTNGEAQK